MRLAAWPHEDPTPFGFKCSINMWNGYRWKAQCLFMDLCPKLSVGVFYQGTCSEVGTKAFSLWIQGFRDFLNALGQFRLSLNRLLVISQAFCSGAVHHNVASVAVIFK